MHKRLIPLALAEVGDSAPIEGRTRLQKMVFVIQQELADYLPQGETYDFFAYDYGPFSKELAEDINGMIESGLIEEEDEVINEVGDIKYQYVIHDKGRSVLESEKDSAPAQKVIEMAEWIKQRYNEDLSLPEVIDEVYSEYPEYAEHSVY